ncbi:hypothetical protein GCM10011360_06050 [Primorskyibacter flagellatus]|uniref:Uncharacterized protein n=1 Tax=Primorskyibacter flagellatus TaxID=1387277 RepID=A0A917ECU7_9RHOB|nr:hypothetical protein [Primorskyibacter flagellatus]GGE20136.1 hypothetical protein GCM10011360_06050 [Primorskyibacter flagellatus]
MSEKSSNKTPPAKAGNSRDDRLKAALKANLARRKSQAKARASGGAGTGGTSDADTKQNKG